MTEDWIQQVGKAGLIVSRRELMRLLGVSAGAVTLGGLLAACGTDDDPTASPDSTPNATTGAAALPTAAGAEATEPAGDATAASTASDTQPMAADVTTGSADRPVLRVGVQALPVVLDPYQELGNVGTRVTYAIYDHLLERNFPNSDPPGIGKDVLPMIAENWERLDDLTLELTLRQDVIFHNGELLTAEDVKFTFDRILIDTPDELVDALGYISTISEVQVVDDYTVRLLTELPDPLLEIRLTSWCSWIMPKAYYEEVGFEEFALAPVGTGPFKFVEMRPDERLVLESHDDYFGGLPTAQRVEFIVIPEVAGRVAALVSGEVDIITNIPPDQVSSLQGADGAVVRSVPLANCHVLTYNTRHPTMTNKLFRQALNLGIDRELLVEALWGGNAVLMHGHQFPEYGEMFNPERPLTPYDPERAEELLEESGYAGDEIVFRTNADYYTLGADAAQAIVQMWQDIGVNARVEVLDDVTYDGVENVQITNWSNSSFVADPDGAFWLRWGAPTAVQRDKWTPEDPRFNELGEQARQTRDFEFRFNAYQEMLDIWEDEAPGTVLYIPIENYGVRSDLFWLPYSFYYMDLRPDNLIYE